MDALHSADANNPQSAESGIARRTVVKGAAWSLPVIAMAVATPMAAASGDIALAFTLPSYATETACGTIDNVTVRATANGNPAPGTPITVTLADGFTFAGGGTTFSGTADLNGQLVLPSINAPCQGGTTALAAVSGAANATASATAPANSVLGYIENGTVKTPVGVPEGSSPAWGNWFLSPTGDLIFGVDGLILESNIAAVGQGYETAGIHLLPVIYKDGTFGYMQDSVAKPVVGVPAGSTPLWGTWFLSPTGEIIFGDTGQVLVGGVAAVGEGYAANGALLLPFVQADGTPGYMEHGTPKPAVGVPAGSTPVWGTWFLSPDGRLIDGVGGHVIASNIVNIGQGYDIDGLLALPVEYADGTFGFIDNGTPATAAGVPAGSTPAWGSWFITPSGDLIEGRDGAQIASNVAEVGPGFDITGLLFAGVKFRPGVC